MFFYYRIHLLGSKDSYHYPYIAIRLYDTQAALPQ